MPRKQECKCGHSKTAHRKKRHLNSYKLVNCRVVGCNCKCYEFAKFVTSNAANKEELRPLSRTPGYRGDLKISELDEHGRILS